ncbi:MAG: M48 family metallopeptidase [Chloroflexi bacterium]|nr:M48 family metallopeptidase [Chloroflexota bacterium]
MPQNETASIESDGKRIDYTIVRSARRKKTLEITIDPEIGVLVRSPANASRKEIATLVHRRAGWILRRTAEAAEPPSARRFADGETMPYLGSEYPIVNAQALSNALTVNLVDGAFRISAPVHIGEEERITASREAFERWYRQEAERLLPDMVANWQSKVSRHKPSRVLIRSQRKRWGSCSSDGSIRLNWRIVMAEPALIDYLVVHELAHLEVMNHSPRYWAHVERVLPDHRARRKRLNEIGMQFWF